MSDLIKPYCTDCGGKMHKSKTWYKPTFRFDPNTGEKLEGKEVPSWECEFYGQMYRVTDKDREPYHTNIHNQYIILENEPDSFDSYLKDSNEVS